MKMDNRYDILESISQREDGTMPQENARLVHVANVIAGAGGDCRRNETKSGSRRNNAIEINEQERRLAERFSKESNCWIPINEIFSLGVPGPSGSESDTYISSDGYIFKTNNLLHCSDSILMALEKFIFYNIIFPDCAYEFVGFTGFDGGTVLPVVKQKHIKCGVPAAQNEIDCYMSALGFQKVEKGKFRNDDFMVWDMFPRNVLKDKTGDFFVIDAEIKLQ